MDPDVAAAHLGLLARDPRWVIARDETVLVAVLNGAIDDDASAAWRGVCADSFAQSGYPRFAVVDTSAAIGASTLPARMRTAAFLRSSAQQMESVALVVGVQTSFLIRTVMRVAGLQNVHLIEERDAAAVLAAYKAGTDWFAGVQSALPESTSTTSTGG